MKQYRLVTALLASLGFALTGLGLAWATGESTQTPAPMSMPKSLLGAKLAAAWKITTVDNSGTVGYYTSLKLDTSNNPHISYYDLGNDDLKYTHFDGAYWHIEVVDSGLGYYGGHTSLALDTFDRPHISYHDSTNYNLKYAFFDGWIWQIEIVDSNESTGQYTSLALDADRWPHISYLDHTNTELRYARKEESWTVYRPLGFKHYAPKFAPTPTASSSPTPTRTPFPGPSSN